MAEQALLSVQHLVKRFGALAATDDASFEVRAGEVHALIGPNGAGKTTLIHQISGALASDSGRILFDGQDLTRLGMAERVQAGLVRSYQITSIFKRFSVLDNLALALSTDAFNRLFANDHPLIRAARDAGMAVVNRIGPARRFFMREAGGAVGDLPRLLRGETL